MIQGLEKMFLTTWPSNCKYWGDRLRGGQGGIYAKSSARELLSCDITGNVKSSFESEQNLSLPVAP